MLTNYQAAAVPVVVESNLPTMKRMWTEKVLYGREKIAKPTQTYIYFCLEIVVIQNAVKLNVVNESVHDLKVSSSHVTRTRTC